jgi:hypothetical protein
MSNFVLIFARLVWVATLDFEPTACVLRTILLNHMNEGAIG